MVEIDGNLRLTNVLEDLIQSLLLNQWAFLTTGQKNAALTYLLQQQLKSAAIAAKIRKNADVNLRHARLPICREPQDGF